MSLPDGETHLDLGPLMEALRAVSHPLAESVYIRGADAGYCKRFLTL
jgi:hypothetical protein